MCFDLAHVKDIWDWYFLLVSSTQGWHFFSLSKAFLSVVCQFEDASLKNLFFMKRIQHHDFYWFYSIKFFYIFTPETLCHKFWPILTQTHTVMIDSPARDTDTNTIYSFCKSQQFLRVEKIQSDMCHETFLHIVRETLLCMCWVMMFYNNDCSNKLSPRGAIFRYCPGAETQI